MSADLMADYNASSETASRWQRCATFTLFHEHGQPSVLHFREEVVYTVDGDLVAKKDKGAIQFEIDGAATFPVLNVLTGDPTGDTASQALLLQLILSLYRAKAAERDGG